MTGLLAALAFLTRLPVPRQSYDPVAFARAVRLYPFAGLAIGGVVAGMGYGAGRIDPWLGALAATAAWAWVTGGLHLDGLADVADGMGAAHGDRDRLLSVMRDPHVGSFGVVALVLQLAGKLVLLALVLPAGWSAVLAVPAAARLGPLVWAHLLPPLKDTGLGAAIAGATRQRDIALWVLGGLAAAVAVPPLLALGPLLLVFALWVRVRLGGVTGDVHGAGIELVETGLLLAIVMTERLAA